MKMIVKIGLDGKTEIRVEGAVGEECLTFTRAIEKALGEVEERKLLPEIEAHSLCVAAEVDVSEGGEL